MAVPGNMPRRHALLLCLGLVYLAIPNLLFLAGWFEPPVAVGVGALLLFYIVRGCVRLWCGSAPGQGVPVAWPFLGALLLLLVLHFLSGGIVGVCKTNSDYYLFRQALFCNLRDAAWPVILPNGKEMTYYLANMLPPAMLARVLPAAWSQWCLVPWVVLPTFLAILLLMQGEGRGARAGVVLVMLLLLRDPLMFLFPMRDGMCAQWLQEMLSRMGWDAAPLFTAQFKATLLNPLHECIGAYNSVPPTLLAAAIMLTCGKEGKTLIPLVYALLLAVSPVACVGLLPLAVWGYIRAWEGGRFRIAPVLRECPLPAAMLCLASLYFLRADGSTGLTLTCVAWNVQGMCLNWGRIALAWALLVLPLVPFERKNPLFVLTALYLLLAPVVFIGSKDFGMNELWLKASPAYMLLLCFMWGRNWGRMPKIKYMVVALCALGTLYTGYKSFHGATWRSYGEVYDLWNGHLNHDHPFLNQSVPPVREPMVPGVLLREPGASERSFPGNVLPLAPGCDYSRPALPHEW